MALNITFTIECHCGAEAETTTTFFGLYPGQPIRIDAEMAVGQTDFTCEKCGCVTGIGDLDTEVGSFGPECDGREGGG